MAQKNVLLCSGLVECFVNGLGHTIQISKYLRSSMNEKQPAARMAMMLTREDAKETFVRRLPLTCWNAVNAT
jgi:hypothetical protein